MSPPQHAVLAMHVVPDLAFAAKIQSHRDQIPQCYFYLLSGVSSDDVKYVRQIHSPYHIYCTALLSVRQQLSCLQPVYLLRRPIRLGCRLESGAAA